MADAQRGDIECGRYAAGRSAEAAGVFSFIFKSFSLRSVCSAVSRFYKSRMSNAESCLTQGKVSNIMTGQRAGFLVYARGKRF